MRRVLSTTGAIAAALLAAACQPSREDLVAEHAANVQRYCTDCHNDAERAAELTLQGRSLASVPEDAATWEKVIRKLRGGMMPPVDAPRPAAETRLALVSFLETELDAAAAASPDPGRTEPFHRLNRNEYRNAVRDLLALDVDVSELLPADDASYGFDNIAGVLKLSPTLLERYINAADKVSRLTVGTGSPYASIDWFRVPDDRSQEQRLPGMPFGTRGGTAVDYVFAQDGEYEIAAELQRDLNEQVPLYAEEQTLEIAIDGERVALFTLPAVPAPDPRPSSDVDSAGSGQPQEPAISQIAVRLRLPPAERALRNRIDEGWRVRVPVKAGTHRVTAAFIARTAALDETPRLPFLRPYPSGVNIPETRTGAYLRAVEISGPYDATGTSATPSRNRIFTCRPNSNSVGAASAPRPPQRPPNDNANRSADPDAEVACAREILSTLARRAYRRPVSADDVAPLLAFFADGRAHGAFDDGIQLALKRLLVSPEFLFRVEHDPEGIAPGAAYPVGDVTLASRLAFFLWSSIPDEELLAAAEEGRLSDAAELGRQVRRMLADPRAAAFTSNFAGQWLYLRNLAAVVPVQSNFPDFDDTLRQGLRRETELFFDSIVREDRSALELLSADYTFLNERVAKHYDIPHVTGAHFRRVQLPADGPRRGLLGHGSILTVTSYPDRTSPVIRGKWILENVLGTPPPPPVPNVPPLSETDGQGSIVSMRERLAAHRDNPNCSGCHALMDPLGFGLENFNAVGQWRTVGDAGEPIDATGTMPDGTPFADLESLRKALLSSDAFVITLTEKLLTYALGRGVEHYDQPAVRKIVRDAVAEDYRFSALVMGVVNSTPFRMRRAQ